MSASRRVVHVETNETLLRSVRWCNTFFSKWRGFTWRRTLAQDDGLVLVEKKDSRLNTAIHMLFVFFDLAVVWINGEGRVVDKVLARPWRLSYTPREAARYVLEAHPDLLQQIEIGDHIRFE
jgi:uncharacterized membrane protein (UPF0127 family)